MDHSPRFLQLVSAVKDRVAETTPEATAAALASASPPLVIDVREDHEWNEGRATGAVHLGKGIIERDIEKLAPDPQAEIVLYCGGGFRSALSADALQKMGYTNVKSMAGGWKAWVKAGLPTTK